jgi:hypothetical protein
MSIPENYDNILNLAETKFKMLGYDKYFIIFNNEKLLSKYICNDSVLNINGKTYYCISESYLNNGIYTSLYSTTNLEILTLNNEINMFICR